MSIHTNTHYELKLLKIRLIERQQQKILHSGLFLSIFKQMELKEEEYGFELTWNILGYVGILDRKHVIISQDSSFSIVNSCRLDGQHFESQ